MVSKEMSSCWDVRVHVDLLGFIRQLLVVVRLFLADLTTPQLDVPNVAVLFQGSGLMLQFQCHKQKRGLSGPLLV